MTKQETQSYRTKLQALADRLSGEVSHLQAEVRRPVGADSTDGEAGSAQEADMPARDAEEELSLSLLGAEETTLAEVRAALDRIERGQFGPCEVCRNPIAKARLDALPYARRCIRCAREAEKAPA